jgi:hypothetical protein
VAGFLCPALAEQSGDVVPQSLTFHRSTSKARKNRPLAATCWRTSFPSANAMWDTEVRPPEPLFLPIAEFETDLLDKPFPPFPPEEIAAQQEQQDFESGWVARSC